MRLTAAFVRSLSDEQAMEAILAGDESLYQDVLRAEAEEHGWRVFFIPDWIWRIVFAAWRKQNSRGGRNWAEPGFPDFVMVRPPELLFVEVKSKGGHVRPAQREWLADLTACGQECAVWFPKHWPEARLRLAQRRR